MGFMTNGDGYIHTHVKSINKLRFVRLHKSRAIKVANIAQANDGTVIAKLENGKLWASRHFVPRRAIIPTFKNKQGLDLLVVLGLITKQDVAECLKNEAEKQRREYEKQHIKYLKEDAARHGYKLVKN